MWNLIQSIRLQWTRRAPNPSGPGRPRRPAAAGAGGLIGSGAHPSQAALPLSSSPSFTPATHLRATIRGRPEPHLLPISAAVTTATAADRRPGASGPHPLPLPPCSLPDHL